MKIFTGVFMLVIFLAIVVIPGFVKLQSDRSISSIPSWIMFDTSSAVSLSITFLARLIDLI